MHILSSITGTFNHLPIDWKEKKIPLLRSVISEQFIFNSTLRHLILGNTPFGGRGFDFSNQGSSINDDFVIDCDFFRISYDYDHCRIEHQCDGRFPLLDNTVLDR